ASALAPSTTPRWPCLARQPRSRSPVRHRFRFGIRRAPPSVGGESGPRALHAVIRAPIIRTTILITMTIAGRDPACGRRPEHEKGARFVGIFGGKAVENAVDKKSLS